jgi:hypothetical protein
MLAEIYAEGVKSSSPGSRQEAAHPEYRASGGGYPNGVKSQTLRDETPFRVNAVGELDTQGALAPLATLGYLI